MGAYVSLLEYNGIEGMILLSELSRRRIRSITKLIKVIVGACRSVAAAPAAPAAAAGGTSALAGVTLTAAAAAAGVRQRPGSLAPYVLNGSQGQQLRQCLRCWVPARVLVRLVRSSCTLMLRALSNNTADTHPR